MSVKKICFYVLGIFLAGAIFIYVLLQIDRQSLLTHLANLNYTYIVPAFLIYCGGILLRSARWRLFYPADDKTSILASYCALVLGNASNLIIPARGGDIVRIVVLGRLSGLSNSKSLATVITERIFDLLMLCLLIGCIALTVPLSPSIKMGAQIIAAISFSGFIAACSIIFIYTHHTNWIDQTLIKRLPQFLHHRVHELLQGLGQGIKLMYTSRAGVVFILYTVLIWTSEIGMLLMLAAGLAFPLGILHSLALYLCTAVGTLVPLSTAQIGVFEFIAVTTLNQFGYDESKAMALGIVWHATILFFPVLLGAATWFFVRPSLNIKSLKEVSALARE